MTASSTVSKPPPNKRKLSWYATRLAVGLLILLVLLILLLYIVMGTAKGSQLILEKVAAEANMTLTYTKGDLRRGVWVSDVKIAEDEDVAVFINEGYVKLGWRAVFAKKIHIAQADVDTVSVINKNAPTDEPFDYATIELPVTLRLENVNINKVVYDQVGKESVVLSGIGIDRAYWNQSDVDIKGGAISVNDTVLVTDINGKITLKDSYPLDIKATVLIDGLDRHHIDPIDVHASGTLKRTYGTIQGRYNHSKVTGEFVVQGLDDNSPFWATGDFDTLLIPYAKEQNITLKNGTVQASGVVSAIDLRINTDLTAKDVPDGHYFGRATLKPTEGMVIDSLAAHTDEGELFAAGSMDWQDDFVLKSTIVGDGYNLQKAVPERYEDYKAYAPKSLTGVLNFNFWTNDDGHTRYQIELDQADGEQLSANIKQKNSPNAPYVIDASWHNLSRHNLPKIGDVDSPSGHIHMVADEGDIQITASAYINKLSALPKGDYTADARMTDGEIAIYTATYQGVMGDLTADGTILLANDNRPLSYTINAETTHLAPNAYFDTPNKTPVSSVMGTFTLLGQRRSKDETDIHDVSLTDTDLTTYLEGNRSVQIIGEGAALVQVKEGKLHHLDTEFDGTVATQGINDGLASQQVSLKVVGDTNALGIAKLSLVGQAGKLSAQGKLSFDNGMGWDMTVQADEFDTQKFYPKSSVILTGGLVSTGLYKDGKIVSAMADLTGDVATANQSSGSIRLNAAAAADKLTINAFDYTGKAGTLSTSGFVDIGRGIVADMKASVNSFDIGHFVKDKTSNLTGSLSIWADWQKDRQHIDIKDLDILGQFNGESVLAKGALEATLELPDDIEAYLKSLKTQANLERLTKTKDTFAQSIATLQAGVKNAQDAVMAQNTQIRRVLKSIKADELYVKVGDNSLVANGTEDKLSVNIEARALSQIVPTIRGQVVGTAVLVGDDNSLPTIYADLTLDNISMPSFALREGSVLGKVVNLGNSESELVIQGAGVVAAGRRFRQVRLDVTGTATSHHIKGFVNDGAMQSRLTIQGGAYDTVYQGIVSEGRLQTRYGVLNQLQPTEIRYGLTNKKLSVAAHCWQSTSENGERGTVCLKQPLHLATNTQSGRVNMVIDSLDTALFAPFMPNDLTVRTKLNGHIDAQWGDGEPDIKAVLYADGGIIGLKNEDVPETTLPFEQISLSTQTIPTGLNVKADIKAGRAGRGYADVIVDPAGDDKAIEGLVSLDELDLAVFRPFFTGITALEGMVNAKGDVGGTLSSPRFYGNAFLSKGKLAAQNVPITLTDIELAFDVNGTAASLDGTFKSGEGAGSVDGIIDWQRQLQARFSVIGDRLLVARPPMLSANISPHLEIVLRPSQRYVDIKGVVGVPTATLRPPERSEAVVDESADVTVIDRRSSTDVEALLAPVVPWSINADIGVDLGDEVVFRGFGAKLPLAGAIRLTQSGQGSMQAMGVVQVSERTSVDIIGQNLELNYAQVRFNGSLTDPILSVEGVREIEGKKVGVRVTNTPKNPVITVFNDAGLSEQQAMNALVTGRLSEAGNAQISEQGFRSQITNSLAAAGLSAGLKTTQGLTNEIGRALGFDSLTVDASGGREDTNVNVTGYINPDLYIRYGVGVFNAKSTLSVRYRLTRRVYFEATSGVQKVVDVVYRWQF